MITAATNLFYDEGPDIEQFLGDVLSGLGQPQKTVPCKYLYDEEGSKLFDAICDLEEYYPTRTEWSIMQQYIGEIAPHLGRDCCLIEYGSGSSLKTRILLDHLERLAGYVPIDISRPHLMQSAARLSQAYPNLVIRPVCADYTNLFQLPQMEGQVSRNVVYFPGSTIGNFDPAEAQTFLSRVAQVCGKGGKLLIGVDLKKDVQVLEEAYNDKKGVTAAFNLNLLRRINREVGGAFRLDLFEHRACYNTEQGRIEMHLVSLSDQTVRVGDAKVFFQRGETIHTENSYKYSLDGFARLAGSAGFEAEGVWTDADQLFSVHLLRVVR